jgi:hypothetical protein
MEEEYQGQSTRSVNERLKEKQMMLDNGRLSVIFADLSIDFKKVYDWGVERNNGTHDAREALRRRLEDIAEVEEQNQKVHLGLSSQSRLVRVQGDAKGHNVQLVQPSLISEEVRWALGLPEP